jgi:hypothetical protein
MAPAPWLDGDVGASDEHARTDNVAAGDGVAQSNVVEGAISADVAHGGEAGVKRDSGVGDHGVSDLRRGLLQNMKRLGIRHVGEMRVAIDQSRKNGEFGKVDDCRACGNHEIFTHGFDPAAADEDHLINQEAAGVDVEESPRAKDGDLRRRRLLRRRN